MKGRKSHLSRTVAGTRGTTMALTADASTRMLMAKLLLFRRASGEVLVYRSRLTNQRWSAILGLVRLVSYVGRGYAQNFQETPSRSWRPEDTQPEASRTFLADSN